MPDVTEMLIILALSLCMIHMYQNTRLDATNMHNYYMSIKIIIKNALSIRQSP